MSKYGLSKEQIEESRRKYGDNTLTQPPRETFWSKLLGNFAGSYYPHTGSSVAGKCFFRVSWSWRLD